MESESRLYFPRRYLVLGLSWWALFVIHSMRVNVGVVVITMLDQLAHLKMSNVTPHDSMDLPPVHWTTVMIGVLHSAFYFGFIITQIPGGMFARKISPCTMLGVAIVVSSLLNTLLPTVIQADSYRFTIVIRFLQGFSEGLVFPCLYRIIFLWFPCQSVHKYGGLIFSGMYAGPIFGFSIDGIIIHYYKWWFIFYFHCILGVVWGILWFLLIYESPQTHPTISKNELEYITLNNAEDLKHNLPWVRLMTSMPFLAVIVCNFVQSWMFIFLLTNEPLYLNKFNFSLLENGIYSALPHVIKVIMTALSGYLSEIIIQSGYISKTNTRKLFNTIGFGTFSLMCFLLYTATSGVQAIAFLSVGVGLKGLTVSGWQINFLDLSPELSAVLAGISLAFGTIGGILSPIVVAVMTKSQTLESWQESFLVSGSILAIGTIFYLIFGSAENQNYNSEEDQALLDEKKLEITNEK